jgi:hypothetical protein
MAHAPAPPPIGLAAWLGLSIVAAATIVLGLQRPEESTTVTATPLQPAAQIARSEDSSRPPLTATRLSDITRTCPNL